MEQPTEKIRTSTLEQEPESFLLKIEKAELPSSARLYALVTSTFNRQTFRTARSQKGKIANWNEEYAFFTSFPEATITIVIWKHKYIIRDSQLGTVTINTSKYINGEEHIDNFPIMLKNEEKGRLFVRLRFKGSTKHLKSSLPKSASLENSSKDVVAPPKQPVKSIKDSYDLGNVAGTIGDVEMRTAKSKSTGESVLVKCAPKPHGANAAEKLDVMKREIAILPRMKHKNVIQYVECFEDETHLYIVVEHFAGSELFEMVLAMGNLSERFAARMIKQILEVLVFMHKMGVVHRDLTPKAIWATEDGDVKIVDFGEAKDTSMGMLKSVVGTPEYIAPELIMDDVQGPEMDIWAVGVISYVLLCGMSPWHKAASSPHQIFKLIMEADYDTDLKEWKDLSDVARDFVKKLLKSDPKDRPSAEEALKLPWIKDNTESGSTRKLGDQNLKEYVRNLRAN